VKSSTRSRPWQPPKSAFAGFRFPPEVIVLAVRWYLRFNLSYRDVEELLVERGVVVDHVTVYRWVQQFTPLLVDTARFCRHSPGDRCLWMKRTSRSTACGDTSMGDRPARAGHRRARVRSARRRRSPAVLAASAVDVEGDTQ
jgi:hypothetical protein